MMSQKNSLGMKKEIVTQIIYMFFYFKKKQGSKYIYISQYYKIQYYIYLLPVVKNSPANAGDIRDGFDPWVRKIP